MKDPCLTYVLSFKNEIYHTVNCLQSFMSSCHHVIMSLYVIMSSCHHVIMSSYYHVIILSFQQMLQTNTHTLTTNSIRTYRSASRTNTNSDIFKSLSITSYIYSKSSNMYKSMSLYSFVQYKRYKCIY